MGSKLNCENKRDSSSSSSSSSSRTSPNRNYLGRNLRSWLQPSFCFGYMRLSAVLLILKRWKHPANSYQNNSAKKQFIEDAVESYSAAIKIEDRGATEAVIAYQIVWVEKVLRCRSEAHTGGTDLNAPNHVTVEYKDSGGEHITTKHVNITFPPNIWVSVNFRLRVLEIPMD